MDEATHLNLIIGLTSQTTSTAGAVRGRDKTPGGEKDFANLGDTLDLEGVK